MLNGNGERAFDFDGLHNVLEDQILVNCNLSCFVILYVSMDWHMADYMETENEAIMFVRDHVLTALGFSLCHSI
jgi:hypothetical protein